MKLRTVCTVLSVVAAVAAPALWIWGDRKAQEKLFEAESDAGELTLKEKALVAGKYYIPGAVTTGVAISANITSNQSATKQIGALAGAGSVAAAAYTRLRNVIQDHVSEEDWERIKEEASFKPSENVNPTWKNEVNWVDEYGNKWAATEEEVFYAEMETNRLLAIVGRVSYYDFLSMAGMCYPPEKQQENGWDMEIGGRTWIDFDHVWNAETNTMELSIVSGAPWECILEPVDIINWRAIADKNKSASSGTQIPIKQGSHR